ncbi:hypothetical protein MFLAVUS_002622 [Mucor flavus]|uniref:Uncharacterized protein n=1 Tax=Mucor flavus TaxID=439312 RepID=A0ABP9YQS5_9FUNG
MNSTMVSLLQLNITLIKLDEDLQNAKKCEKKIEDFGDFEICYNVDPKQSILVLKQRIRDDPFTYRTYLHSGDMPDENLKRKRIEFQTEIQVIQFINEVYLSEEPQNTKIHGMKSVSIVDIYDTCSNARLSFLRAQEERNNNIRVRSCRVMEEQFHGKLKY